MEPNELKALLTDWNTHVHAVAESNFGAAYGIIPSTRIANTLIQDMLARLEQTHGALVEINRRENRWKASIGGKAHLMETGTEKALAALSPYVKGMGGGK